MKNKRFNTIIKRLLAVLIIAMLFVATAAPAEASAASLAKKKAKYILNVNNLSSQTVVPRGGTYQISASAYINKGGTRKGTKVRYKSSKKKVATVSSRGLIRGKKNGTVKITVRSKGKKKTYKIRVGTPVSSMYITGYHYLRKGKTATLKAHVNSNATNKTVHWRCSNTKVATIDNNGKLKAKGYGTATITAYAVDGSGVAAQVTVAVPKYYAYPGGGIKWIAHRGLHTSATENTAAAFRAAGQTGGFWGCECDIWETKHETVVTEVPDEETSAEEETENTDNNTEEAQDPGISGAALDTESETGSPVDEMAASEEEPAGETSVTEETIESDEAAASEASGTQEPQVSAKATVTTETFDLVINHDDTFQRTMGVNRYIKDMTAADIRSAVPGACFFGDYLDICKQYGMVPVVEFKDPYMSDEGVKKAVDMLADKGQLESACLISFYSDVLERVNNYATEKLGHKPYTAYLIASEDLAAVDHAKAKGYTCISVTKSALTNALYNKCVANGLKVGTWTYRENMNNDYLLYLHTSTGQFNIDFATVDYKPF